MNTLAIAEEPGGAVKAKVVDLADMSCFEAETSKLTDRGCWITSDKVDLLKDEIGLLFPGQGKLVRARVIAFGDNTARIAFAPKPQADERRREIRRPVWIEAIVCSSDNPLALKCRIVDASVSGCRLESEHLSRLSDGVEISIPKLNLPVNGKIVWRGNNQAGVQLKWPFDPDPAPRLESLLKETRHQGKRPVKPRKRISAFGS